ncbi:CPBP family intramembrane metalloprotease [Edaphobacter sp. HDX4]|uniref:CPBP family intramembrane glutamic endopeptidase n=1 Tax=Edaphobacter sp. HDX4 TaxID=2794064 RepID=UPI002FE5CB4B
MSEIIPIDQEQHPLSRIFFGPFGLRAGWSLLIALILFLALMWGFSSALRITHLVPAHTVEHTPGPLSVFLSEATAFLAIAIVTVIMSRVEHRPLAVYGLGGSRKASRMLYGVVTGLIAISLLVFILLNSGLLIIDQRLLFGSEVARYLLLWIPGFLAIGLFEEYLFRGYLQYTLARGLSGVAPLLPGDPDPRTVGFWIAAVVVSFGFGAVHGSNPGESPAGLICAGAASLVFCFSLWRTGSLWWAIGLHAAWDYGQSVLFGVSDSGALFDHRLLQTHPVGAPLLSGGATGPEGSIFCLIPLLLLVAVIHLSQRRPEESYALQMPALSHQLETTAETLPPASTPTS